MSDAPPSPGARPDPLTGRRGPRRYKVFLPAILTAGPAEYRIHILDLSARGARGHVRAELPKGAAVGLRLDTLVIPALIQWRAPPLYGISFHHPLPAETLSRLLP